MDSFILSASEKEFIQQNITKNSAELLLKYSHQERFKFLVQQIVSRQKIKHKLPAFYSNFDLIFPKTLNLEQSSSEITADYKSQIISGNKMVDLTAGFGIDVFAFSKKVNSIIHVEPEKYLSEIVTFNYNILGIDNVSFINKTAEDFLENNEQQFDFVYLDPSRRKADRKTYLLEDYSPNMVDLQHKIFEKTNHILLKTSPLLDIKLCLSKLKGVKEVHVVSVKNDCKEILYLMENAFVEEPKICCINLYEKRIQKFEFKFSKEQNLQIIPNDLDSYIYEPNHSVLNAGAFKILTKRFGLSKLAVNTHLYSSEVINENFPGNVYKVLKTYSQKDFIKNKEDFNQLNVKIRNSRMTPERLSKILKINNGVNLFAFFYRDKNDIEKVCLAEILRME